MKKTKTKTPLQTRSVDVAELARVVGGQGTIGELHGDRVGSGGMGSMGSS